MTTAGGMARKVQQLDNDVQAVYEMLHSIQSTQTRQQNRLNEIATTQDEHTATLAEHGATLAEHGSKLDRIIALLEQR